LVQKSVVFDDDLTLAFALDVSAHLKCGQFPVLHLQSSNDIIRRCAEFDPAARLYCEFADDAKLQWNVASSG
jgi:hypothetical protein